MKYKDVLMFFVGIGFISSFGYAIGVDTFFWFIPVTLFVLMLYLYYALWIQK